MKNETKSTNQQAFTSLETATGTIPIPLTNDMLFHYVMQKSNVALKGLVCALKGLNPDDVESVQLTNQIDYNEAGKEIVLDVKVVMNNAEIMNIELQMYSDDDWIKRSLLYLCRAYDSISSGDAYAQLKPATHIGIMGYDLFPDSPEFYAHYLMSNVRTHRVYSPIFGINVLSLNRIDMATEQDCESGLDYWAQLFLARTWEDVKLISADKEDFMAVAETMYEANADVKQRSLFEARMKYKEIMASKDYKIARLEKENDQYRRENERYQQRIAELEAQLAVKE